ncbi:hypothetical protein BDC45DRAFT_525582 [Circinella umbellata]|nr:hypothetical protein BDC45DRAFT_525582 [Circinella umbellata]
MIYKFISTITFIAVFFIDFIIIVIPILQIFLSIAVLNIFFCVRKVHQSKNIIFVCFISFDNTMSAVINQAISIISFIFYYVTRLFPTIGNGVISIHCFFARYSFPIRNTHEPGRAVFSTWHIESITCCVDQIH